MAKELPRGAVVSVRLSDQEQDRLRAIADESGTSVSEVIRDFVNREMRDPLPRGVSVSPTRDMAVSDGSSPAFRWLAGDWEGASGATITTRAQL